MGWAQKMAGMGRSLISSLGKVVGALIGSELEGPFLGLHVNWQQGAYLLHHDGCVD